MSSVATTTGPIPAPTNTVYPLPATPAEVAAGTRPTSSGTALDLHTQTEDAAKDYKNAQKAEKAYAQKKKCMTARKEWYDCKVHFAAGMLGFKEGGKCVGRVVKAGPALAMEKVQGRKGKGVKSVDSGISGESMVVEKEKAKKEKAKKEKVDKKSGNGGVKAKVAGLKEKLLAMKEKRTMEKNAKANEKAGIATPTASGAAATATTPVAAAPVAPVVATPAQTKQEKKRMTLDQVRDRILSYRHTHFSWAEEDEEEVNAAPRIAGWMTYFLPFHLLLVSLSLPSYTFEFASRVLDSEIDRHSVQYLDEE